KKMVPAMSDFLRSIDLNLSRKLHDREYRRKFFLAECSALIARQLIELRKRRGLNQKSLAELAGTGQPAISRAERADYQNWSFNTLRRLAEAMDARIRVLIEPAEDVLTEYREPAQIRSAATASPPSRQYVEQKLSGEGKQSLEQKSVISIARTIVSETSGRIQSGIGPL